MENLIYILIGIAWVAYSVYSARQKAIQKQHSAGRPPRGPAQSSPLPIPGNQGEGKNLFDEILRELTGEPRPVPQVDRPVFSPAPVSYQKSKAEAEPVIRSTRYTTLEDINTDFPANKSAELSKTKVLDGQMTEDEGLVRKFNLREAVIYSEILNRKYV